MKRIHIKERGITLIALVITIIILLILAGISITQLAGNGLLEKAKQASEKTKDAESYQNEIMNSYEKEIGKYINGEKYLIGHYKITGYNQENGKLAVTITIDKDSPIESIVCPNGDTLTYNGEKKIELNYEVIDGEENKFVLNVNGEQENYLIQTKGFTKKQKSTIENGKDLEELSIIVNMGNTLENKTIEVTDDINLKDICYKVDGNIANDKSWIPIGNESNYFQGTFNGNGHKISNLYINNNGNSQGLFGYIGEKSIVERVTIEKSELKASSGLGGVTGRNYGIVKNCVNNADLETSGNVCGGITANNFGIIYRCKNYGTIKSSQSAGGISGNNAVFSGVGFIIECINHGDINASSYCSGGITSKNGTHATDAVGYICNCYNTGTISGGVYKRGGIVGGIRYQGGDSYIYNCYNRGNTNGGADIIGCDDKIGKTVDLNNYSSVDATIEKLNVKSEVEQALKDTGLYDNNVWGLKDGVIALNWE